MGGNNDNHKILTKTELSKALSISTKTIERFVDKGLPMLRGGSVIRFEFSKVVEWMEKNAKKYKENIKK